MGRVDTRYRAVLIDALGTLVRLEPPAPRLRAELRARGGPELSEPEVSAALAAEIDYYLAHQLEGRDPETLAALRSRCAEVLRTALPEGDRFAPGLVLDALLASLCFEPYADAAPALAELRAAGVSAVAVSNWDCSLGEVLGRTGLGELLDGVVCSAVVGAAKPDPAPFIAGLELAGALPSEALHVGDSVEADVAGARTAGVDGALLARSGEPPAELGVPVLRSLAELPSLVFAAAR